MSEIQNQIEYMVAKFQDSITKFENLMQSHLDLTKDNENTKNIVSNLENKLSVLLNDFTSLIYSHTEKDKSQEKINLEIKTLQEKQDKLNEFLTKDIFEINKNLEDLKGKVTLFPKKIDELSNEIANVDSKYSDVPDKILKLDDPVNFCQTEINKLKNMILEDESLIKNINALSNKNEKNILDATKSCNEMFYKHEELIKEIQNKQMFMSDDFSKFIDQRISEIPKPVIPTIEEINKSFLNDLESIRLDARNSILRTNNSETRINLAEKRIEQVQLLLKKYNLDQ